jgi:hypothetical protein
MSVNYTAKMFYGIAIPADLMELPSTDKVEIIFTGNGWGKESHWYAIYKESLTEVKDDYTPKSLGSKTKHLKTREMYKEIMLFLQNYKDFEKIGDWYLALVVS